MIIQKNLIGTKLLTETVKVDEFRINYLYQSVNISDYQRQNNMVPNFFLGSFIDFLKIQLILNLNVKNILLTRESITSHQTLRVGDTFNVQVFLQDIYERQATINPIGFVVLDFMGSINKEYIFRGERIWAVRGGFERRKT